MPKIAVIITKRALDKHKKSLSFASLLRKNPMNFQCNFCQKSFASQVNLDGHCKTVHEGQNNLEKSIHEEKNAEVQNSEIQLTKKQFIEKHIGTSGGNEIEQTDEKCKQTAKNNVSVKSEKLSRHEAKTREITPEKIHNNEDLNWTLACLKCKKNIQIRNYESHLKHVHQMNNVKIKVKTKPSS